MATKSKAAAKPVVRRSKRHFVIEFFDTKGVVIKRSGSSTVGVANRLATTQLEKKKHEGAIAVQISRRTNKQVMSQYVLADGKAVRAGRADVGKVKYGVLVPPKLMPSSLMRQASERMRSQATSISELLPGPSVSFVAAAAETVELVYVNGQAVGMLVKNQQILAEDRPVKPPPVYGLVMFAVGLQGAPVSGPESTVRQYAVTAVQRQLKMINAQYGR